MGAAMPRGPGGSAAGARRAGCARRGAHTLVRGRLDRRQPQVPHAPSHKVPSLPASFLAGIIPFVMIPIDFLQALNF